MTQSDGQSKPANLGPHAWITAPETKAVMAALGADAARFVGGCVRNTLIGAAVDDVDIATVHEPKQTMARLEAAGLKAVPTGIDHGTVTAIANGKPFEVTTLRRDVATDGRRATVAFTGDWAEDAARRDFTMNAIYADGDGALYDPVDGIEDARAGRVRFIGDARARIEEDYLRILRFFRIFAWYGKGEMDGTALTAAADMKEGLARLSGERIQKEMLKLLGADHPLPALRAMKAAGILEEVLPGETDFERLERLLTIENGQLFTCDADLRLGALLKGGAPAVEELADRLKLSNALRERLTRMHTNQSRIVSYLSAREVRRTLYWAGPRTFADRVKLAWADDPKASNAVQWRALLAMGESWQRPDLPLTGEEVKAAGVPEGPEVGRVLREVEEWWADSDFTEDRLSVIERLKAIVQATVY